MALSIVLLEDGSRLDTEDGADSLALQDSDSPTALQFDDNSGLDPLRYQAADLGSTFTVCFWARPTGPLVTSDDRSIWCQELQSSTADSIHIEQLGDGLQLLLDFGNVANIANVFAADTWTFIALTSNVGSTTFTIYYGVPGETLHSQTAGGFGTTAATQRILIAGVTPFSGSYFRGDIAGMRLWNAVLNSTELQAEADSVTAVKTASLWASWKLDSSANKLVDSGPSSRTLTALSTGPWTDINDGPPVTIASAGFDPASGFPYPDASPDFFARPRRTYDTAEQFVLDASPPPTVNTGWMGDLPDFVRGRAFVVAALAAGICSLVIPEREPDLDWQPEIPDFAARAAPRAPTGGLFWTNLEREPTTDWQPDFPDFARAARPALNTGGLSWTNLEREPVNDWQPDLPDFAWARARPLNVGGLFWTNLEREPDFDWQPEFPDSVRGAAPLVREGWEVFSPLPIASVAVPLQFYPDYPDRAYARAQPLNVGGLFWTNLEREPTTDWQPDLPDFARTSRPTLNVGGLSLWPLPITSLVVPLQFHPEYPDRVYARARPLNVGGLFWTNLEREPAVDWLPDFPDFARARPLVREGLAAFYPFPLPLVIAPTQWSPEYPDQTYARARPVNVGGVGFERVAFTLFVLPAWAKGATHAVVAEGRLVATADGRAYAILGSDARLDTETDTGKRRDET